MINIISDKRRDEIALDLAMKEIDCDCDIERIKLRLSRGLSSSEIAERMFDIEASRNARKQLAYFEALGYKVRVK